MVNNIIYLPKQSEIFPQNSPPKVIPIKQDEVIRPELYDSK
jgi:hypothetical protein